MTEAYAEQMTQAQSIKGIPTLLDSAKHLLVRSCWTVRKVIGAQLLTLEQSSAPVAFGTPPAYGVGKDRILAGISVTNKTVSCCANTATRQLWCQLRFLSL